MYYFLIFAGRYQLRTWRGASIVLNKDTIVTKILEIEEYWLFINIELIPQYKHLNSYPIRGWRT